jgi:acyl transferase domain-containing protein
MFSGQGSQYHQMGKKLFEHHSVFRRWMVMLDAIARDVMGESVLDHLYDEKKRIADPFDRLLHSHPAIFMVEYSLGRVLLDSGIRPDYVLGTSLGEYASAAFAGVMTAEELFKAVIKQAEFVESGCNAGRMIAILHDARLYYDDPLIRDTSELASVNFGSHFVISGERKQIKDIEHYLKERNILYQSLPVSYGFHSSSLDPAAPAFKTHLQQMPCQKPRVPFLSSLHGMLLDDIPRDYLWDVVRMPVQFPKTVRELENDRECVYLDLGPGGTLANFAKRNLAAGSRSKCYAIITPFQQETKNLATIEGLFPATIF